MKTFPTLVKTSARCFALLITIVCVQGLARADEVMIAGTTGGAQATALPEPASLLLLGTAMVGLGTGMRRRHRKV